jgi:L-histidine Nalpha-methyltransferase
MASQAAPGISRSPAEIMDARSAFARAVRHGLCQPQKELPAEYFYDAIGSALFDVITLLPEYGLTRADERVIRRHAREIAWRLAPGAAIAELGSGSGSKTRPILEAMGQWQERVSYCAIDVSRTALESCRQQLSGLRGVQMESLERSYLAGLAEFRERRRAAERLLVLFLGSSIGNFRSEEAADFLRQVRECLHPGDALLLGTDLLKAPEQLLAAYDDPAGVTAAFNLNLLARINRELGGDFDLRNFRHEARWRPAERRIEMHLVSLVSQSPTISGADCRISLEPGETIWTESCHKFDPSDLIRLAQATGFECAAQWIDCEWPFAENLWIAGRMPN